MTQVTHRTPWKNTPVEARRLRYEALSDEQVRQLVRAVRAEQREKALARHWSMTFLFLFACMAALFWLTQTASGQAVMAWMEGL